MKLNPFIILAAVAALMLVLALIDMARHQRITPGAKARLLVAAIMGFVLVWQGWFKPQ
jgi:hypothetical protein